MSEPAGLYVTKSDYAYTRIRELILSGDLEPGTVLQQAQLAKTIGISTTPLREAMRRLMMEGLVSLDAHRDARVSALTGEEARDLLELRLSLDPLACALAAQRRTKDDIARMRATLAKCRALSDEPTIEDLVAHRAFHQAVYVASHNDMLIGTLNGLWDKADRYRLMGLQTRRSQLERDQKDDEHRRLLDAVVRGDGDDAAAVMLQHIGTSLGAKAASRLGVEPTATPHLA